MIELSRLEKILLRVQKPARYVGGEYNIVVKPEARFRMAVSYPDLYEVGMSNNGIRILYDIVNRMDGAACERVFTVEHDFERLLRSEGIPLYTLETFTPLHELDLVAFNLSHEMLYTNMLQVLDLGGIPLLAGERSGNDPIVIAGGGAVSNPFPLKDFLDAVYLGDGEEGVADIVQVLADPSVSSATREEKLSALERIEGVLLPRNYALNYKDGKLVSVNGPTVTRRVYRQRKAPAQERPLVPNIRISQERVVAEATRGCANLCKFCHAGYFDLPYRAYSDDDIRDQVHIALANTGYSEVALSSLSLGDYRDLTGALNRLLPELTARGVSLSLPSLRVDRKTLPVIERVSDVRRTSLTFAVESAADPIRETAYKRINMDELLEIITHVFDRGWRMVKLYFMIGLPGSGEIDEAKSIIDLLKQLLALGSRNVEINATVSPFVPKPHTPFQRERQMGRGYTEDTVLRIKQGLPRRVKIKNHDLKASEIEGVLSRGDDRLGQAILGAYRKGCRLDSWGEYFDYGAWRESLDENLPGWEKILHERGRDDVLPWEVVKTGFDRVISSMEGRRADLSRVKTTDVAGELHDASLDEAMREFEKRYVTSGKVRLRLTKTGMMRYVPHIDFVEIVKRALRMAEAPMAFTRGFNKREKISAGYPIPLGIESEAELLDVELFDSPGSDLAARMNERLPEGIRVTGFAEITGKESLMAITIAALYRVECETGELCSTLLDGLSEKKDFVKITKKGEFPVLFNDVMLGHEQNTDTSLYLTLSAGSPGSMRADRVVLSLADLGDEFLHRFRITKTAQYRKNGDKFEEI